MPAFRAFESFRLMIETPEETHVPAKTVANSAQDAGSCLLDCRCLRKNLRDGESCGAIPLEAASLADIPQVGGKQRRAFRGNAGNRHLHLELRAIATQGRQFEPLIEHRPL